MGSLEKIKETEDEICRIVEHWPKWKLAMLYRYLHGLGFRIGAVDTDIRDGLKAEK